VVVHLVIFAELLTITVKCSFHNSRSHEI